VRTRRVPIYLYEGELRHRADLKLITYCKNLATRCPRETPREFSAVAPLLRLRSLVLGAILLISGCAFDVIRVQQVPVRLEAISGPAPEWTLSQDVYVRLREGFAAMLKSGTTWRPIGRIAQGDVFRTSDQTVTVEASNVYEAALVMKADTIVGFYLIVEHSFTEADPPIQIKRAIRAP
jgi:hypothetical protein